MLFAQQWWKICTAHKTSCQRGTRPAFEMDYYFQPFDCSVCFCYCCSTTDCKVESLFHHMYTATETVFVEERVPRFYKKKEKKSTFSLFQINPKLYHKVGRRKRYESTESFLLTASLLFLSLGFFLWEISQSLRWACAYEFTNAPFFIP